MPALSELPTEIVLHIFRQGALDALAGGHRASWLSKLARVSRQFHDLATTLLYRERSVESFDCSDSWNLGLWVRTILENEDMAALVQTVHIYSTLNHYLNCFERADRIKDDGRSLTWEDDPDASPLSNMTVTGVQSLKKTIHEAFEPGDEWYKLLGEWAVERLHAGYILPLVLAKLPRLRSISLDRMCVGFSLFLYDLYQGLDRYADRTPNAQRVFPKLETLRTSHLYCYSYNQETKQKQSE